MVSPLYVLEYEVRRLQLDHQANEVFNERVPGVVERAFADHAEALAWSSSEKNVHRMVADAGMVPDVFAIDLGYTAADGRAAREIKLMCRAVNRVVFDGCRHVESGLFEAEAHPARPREKIDAYGSFSVAAHQTKALPNVSRFGGGDQHTILLRCERLKQTLRWLWNVSAG
ncbi:MAG TPA: hypothetical protein VN924_07455, partial [Bryobacteraceae bacterium]|nr:hypothetical protein [Bryobacteraceae bacterium]